MGRERAALERASGMRHVNTNLGMVRNWFGLRRSQGAAVAFETPALRMARVCDDAHDGLIAILRDFANNGSIYIVPWKSLTSVVPMTDHDLALHQAVADHKATTPEKMRVVVRDLTLSGALGADAQLRAVEDERVGLSQAADAELVLIHELLRSCGVDFAMSSGRWNARRTRAAVDTATSSVEASGEEIYQRIRQFALLMQPIGLIVAEGSCRRGWLRVLHGEIRDFGEHIATGDPSVPTAASADLAAIAAAATRTAEISDFVLNALDYAVRDLVGTLKQWNNEAPVLRQAIERLAVILDGWPALMKAVQEALRGPPEALITEIRTLRSIAPELSVQQSAALVQTA